MNQCPHCGKELTPPGRIRRTWRAYNGWRARQRTELASDALVPWEPQRPAGSAGHFEAVRETPARAMTVESDFLAPFLQSVAVGLFAMGATGYGVWLWNLQWHLICIVPIASSGLFFLALLGANRKLLWVVESIIDIPEQPPPTWPPPTVRVESMQSDAHGTRWQFADLAVDQARLIEFAKDIEAGHGFTERTAKRAKITQEELKSLRGDFIDRGWAGWRNPDRPQQGITLSRNGKAIIRAIAAAPYPAEGQ